MALADVLQKTTLLWRGDSLGYLWRQGVWRFDVGAGTVAYEQSYYRRRKACILSATAHLRGGGEALRSDQGSLLLWFKPNWAYDTTTYHYLFDWGDNTSNRLALLYNPSNDGWAFWHVVGGTNTPVTSAAQSFAAGTWLFLAVYWQPGGVGLSVNGGAFATGAPSSSLSQPSAEPFIGADQTGGQQADGTFALMMMCDSAITTTADVTAVYNLTRPPFWPHPLLIPGRYESLERAWIEGASRAVLWRATARGQPLNLARDVDKVTLELTPGAGTGTTASYASDATGGTKAFVAQGEDGLLAFCPAAADLAAANSPYYGRWLVSRADGSVEAWPEGDTPVVLHVRS